jgi:cold shock protein
MSETFTGTVKFVADSGFIFLTPDSGTGPDIFGHCADWEKNGLRAREQGERYEFEVVSAKRGPRAINPRPEPPGPRNLVKWPKAPQSPAGTPWCI